jgi:hypothetical protein
VANERDATDKEFEEKIWADADIEEQDDDEPFDEKMRRLTREFSEQLQISQELGEEIKRRLGIMGFLP